MARREMGGGALLDESHWIDLMLWLFGMPSRVSGRIEKISDLEIDSDDNVDLLFAYDAGPRVSIRSHPQRASIRLQVRRAHRTRQRSEEGHNERRRTER